VEAISRAAGPFALVVAAGLVSCTLEGAAAEQERPSPAGLAVRSAPHIGPSPQHLVIATCDAFAVALKAVNLR